MDFALRCAYAHGTAAIRTHLDSAPPQHDITWDVFSRMREKWRGRIELQACSIVGPDTCVNPDELDAVATAVKAARRHSRRVDRRLRRSAEGACSPRSRRPASSDSTSIFTSTKRSTLDSMALRHLADAVIETGFNGPVVAGHCCVLSVQDPAIAMKTIERVAEAGIAIVSLPMCNIYLMDRDPAGTVTPIRRGPTLLKELRAAGVRVAIASDNTRDPFYAYGDLDGLEVLREGARIVHFDHPQAEAWTWAQRGRRRGLPTICGFNYRARIEAGAPADLVLFRARIVDRADVAAAERPHRAPQRQGDRHHAPRLPRARRPDGGFVMDLSAFRAALGDIPVQDNPRIVQQKSRDHYWYSPRLKAELEKVTAEIVVSPRTQDEVVTVLRAAFAHGVPITPRGAGTGNYGQAMPLSGGAMLDLMGLDRVVKIEKDRVRAEAGVILEKLDEQTIHAVGGEMRFHPSTYRMAIARRVHRRRVRRGRLDPLGRPPRLRQSPRPQGHHRRGRAARPRSRRPRHPQGRARLRHQRHHRRSRDSADGRTTTGST